MKRFYRLRVQGASGRDHYLTVQAHDDREAINYALFNRGYSMAQVIRVSDENLLEEDAENAESTLHDRS